MFNIGAGEMVFILVAALLVLGPTRLPEMARAIGKFMREFRRQTDDVRVMVEREFYRMESDELRGPPKSAPPQTPDPSWAAGLPTPEPLEKVHLPPAAPPEPTPAFQPAPNVVARGTVLDEVAGPDVAAAPVEAKREGEG